MSNMQKLLVRAMTGVVAFSPVIALAQFGDINDFISDITSFINNVLIPLVFAIALLVFIWGMFQLFINKNAEEAEQGKKLALYAIVAFVLMVSIWGIVNVIASGLGFSGEQIQNIPSVPSTGGSSGRGN
ncbi:hypothetical protein A2837_00625 [Candidatus Kaiserbacteria bacterium RIFCSPHIGHO2_01_FULL_46_22]|uniref:Uncharacterized protein n=1 Tax=Candidatus Kaiserbacteria bacterium RIFCSPHIGHO2_01_FULL_46_22 TaxID=1798475 RepID=A0A1F6BXF8_9BACT|nr:MAG: hypothetical protein A2837_00625 [Candidatus Kaiserbacteria bacterium RIFCSPHIGHO2_01_FULL_46_22]